MTTIPLIPGIHAHLDHDWPLLDLYLRRLPPPATAPSTLVATARLRTDPALPLKEDVATACAVEWRPLGPTRASLSVYGFEGTVDHAGPVVELDVRIHPDAPYWAAILFVRTIAKLALARHGYLLIHASCVVLGGRAVLCLGHSTAGKTTTARRAGRAGALRIADDMLVLRRQGDALAVRPFVTDRAARLPGRLDRWWDLHRAYLIAKGAAATRVTPLANPLATWCEALMSASLTHEEARFAFDMTLELCERVPLRQFEVAPSGDVLGPLRADLES